MNFKAVASIKTGGNFIKRFTGIKMQHHFAVVIIHVKLG